MEYDVPIYMFKVPNGICIKKSNLIFFLFKANKILSIYSVDLFRVGQSPIRNTYRAVRKWKYPQAKFEVAYLFPRHAQAFENNVIAFCFLN